MKNQLNLIHFNTIDSTNKWVKRNLDKLSHDSINLITTNEQTAGQGQFKRPWSSPDEGNIYATYHFTRPLESSTLPKVGQICALTLYQLLKQSSISVQLKWPNDILLKDKKLAGILCETTRHSNLIHFIVGIGINVNMSAETLNKITQKATSLSEETNSKWNESELLHQFTSLWIKNLFLYFSKGISPFNDEINRLIIYK
jgi:BirA family transcriptional regulator, biotin operon repressor / biotin---[acetyl-CoA-carboxylase] ligase